MPGVDPAAERDRTARGRVGPADAFDQLPAGRDRRRRVVRSGHAAEEETDDLVADELVDQSVVVEDRLRPDLVEVAEERPEIGRTESLADARSTRGRRRTGG